MVNFYFTYTLSPLIEIKPTFSDYLENLDLYYGGIGVLFQMPLLVMVLAKIGVVTGRFLKKIPASCFCDYHYCRSYHYSFYRSVQPDYRYHSPLPFV